MTTASSIQAILNKVHSPAGFPFPQTVAAFLALGVTRYHVDYADGHVTSYRPAHGDQPAEVHRTEIPTIDVPTNVQWNAGGVVDTIRRVQAGKINYLAFSRECVDSGVIGYFAFLTGKKVVYYSAEGDVHVEWFPGAGPDIESS